MNFVLVVFLTEGQSHTQALPVCSQQSCKTSSLSQELQIVGKRIR